MPAKEPRHEKDEKKQGYERPCGSDSRRILWLVLLVLRHNFPTGSMACGTSFAGLLTNVELCRFVRPANPQCFLKISGCPQTKNGGNLGEARRSVATIVDCSRVPTAYREQDLLSARWG